MKFFTIAFCTALIGATAAQADIINRRNQCDKWEYIPANEALGSSQTALLFCTEEENVWLSLRVECLADEKRMAVTYRPGFAYDKPARIIVEPVEQIEQTEDQLGETLFAQIPLENIGDFPEIVREDIPRDMVFFDFRSFGYTSVAYFDDNADWQFFEPEPMSPVFSKLITGSYADISLLATGTTERLPLRGSGKALRPIVETCRKAKRNG